MKEQFIFNIANGRSFYNRHKKMYIEQLGVKWHADCPFFDYIDEHGDHKICPVLVQLYWNEIWKKRGYKVEHTTNRQPDIHHDLESLSCYKFHCLGILNPDCPIMKYDIVVKVAPLNSTDY